MKIPEFTENPDNEKRLSILKIFSMYLGQQIIVNKKQIYDLIQYLIKNGFDVPFLELDRKTAIESGIAVAKNNY